MMGSPGHVVAQFLDSPQNFEVELAFLDGRKIRFDGAAGEFVTKGKSVPG